MSSRYGFNSLIRKEVTFICKNNIYTGILVDVHDDHIVIAKPKMLFEEGTKRVHTDELFIQRSHIECYGELAIHDNEKKWTLGNWRKA